MGIMVSKDLEKKTELNRRIASDLRARNQGVETYDAGSSDDYLENTKPTGRFTWIWILLVVLAVISLICIVFI